MSGFCLGFRVLGPRQQAQVKLKHMQGPHLFSQYVPRSLVPCLCRVFQSDLQIKGCETYTSFYIIGLQGSGPCSGDLGMFGIGLGFIPMRNPLHKPQPFGNSIALNPESQTLILNPRAQGPNPKNHNPYTLNPKTLDPKP